MENDVATFHEFGNFVSYSSDASDEIKDDARKTLEYSFHDLLKYTPDKIWKEGPTFLEMPVVDRLQRFSGMGYRMMFASPIYDYFDRVKKGELVAQEHQIKSRLRRQSNKNWWTRLLWKLGGFDCE